MTTWLQFLADQGAGFDEAAGGELTGFGAAAAPSSFMAPLTDLGLIAVSGEEGAQFLHNQLTNDVEHLGSGEARLAGYCSPKGRLLATLLMWKAEAGIMLQLPKALQPAIQKRLQMFVLRAKAKLADAVDEAVAIGLAGQQAQDALGNLFPQLPAADYAKVDAPAGSLIRMPDAFNVPRYLWITRPETAQQAWPTLSASVPPAAPSLWRRSQIAAGIPQITPATQDQFVPQMVNFELVGGVNFRKGCYPGQEIVARSQYLGKLKRRMMRAEVDAAEVRAGMEIFAASDPDQPCGMVVNAEPNDRGGADCLVEIKLALAEAGIRLGTASGPEVRLAAVPYPVTEPA
ncbi:hypothetical protein SAMN06265795_106168 [Noviherbaspirillum humi]|uniref:Uncharacterized protein n=1 Tax=Noviherbaspirillum humi TaxID=1688639 RepID=A0A239HCF0_9BURK|nr:folate-binding protein YgfZ [Noviherbaspirillum humi]SNS78473.1 hypothetical protein SAMN06265795_106168 [Noviherbaspirillum humi]